MARKATIIVAAIVSSIPIGVFARIQAQKDIPLHHFEMPCGSCHELQSGVSPRLPSDRANVGRIKGDINQLCTASGCHSFDPMLSHPLGVVQRDGIQSDMPLDEQSRLTCLTCHDRPRPSNSSQLNGIQSERILHRPDEPKFCAKCHAKMGGTVLKRSHWQFSTRAHLGTSESQSAEYAASIQFAGRIDLESRTCLSCHDEVFATMPAYGLSGRRQRQLGGIQSDHPIGTDYLQAASRRAGRFTFLPMGNQRIRLFDGKVGCGSCHSLYAKTKNALVEPFERDVLCKKCHLL